jgi:subtilase family serine protease
MHHFIRNSFRLSVLAGMLLLGLSSGPSRAATLVWTNVAGGQWNVSANWTPNQIPAAADDAYITNAGTYVVTISANAAARLVVGGPGSAPTLEHSGGTLGLGNTSELRAGAAWKWSGGTLAGGLTVMPGANMNITGTSTKFLEAAITNRGVVLHDNTGGLYMYGNAGAKVVNEGTWEIQGNPDIYGINGKPLFLNIGQVRRTSGTGTARLGNGASYPIALENPGSIEAQTGVLELHGGGVVTGVLLAAAGARIDIATGAWVQNAVTGPQVSGSGAVRFTGTTLELLSVVPGLQLASGTVTLSPAFQGGSITNLVLQGATLGGSNYVTGTLTCQSLNGPLLVAGSAFVTWIDGTISAPLNVQPGGTLQISGSATKYLRAGVTNLGNVLHQAGALYAYGVSGAAVDNRGVWDVQGDADLYGIDGTPVFRNAGVFRKSTGTGTANLGVTSSYPLDIRNSGTIETLSGTLRVFRPGDMTNGVVRAGSGAVMQLYGGGYLAGSFLTETNARIEFPSGTWTQVPGLAAVGGSGVLRFTGGTMELRELIPTMEFRGGTLVLLPDFQGGAITNLLMQGATLSGSNFVTGTLTCQSVTGPLLVGGGGTVNWNEGTISGPLVVQPGGVLQLNGSATKFLRGGLTNLGSVFHQSGGLYAYGASGAAVENRGVWDVPGDSDFYGIDGAPVFRNQGVFRKSAGTGTAQLGVTSSYPVTLQNAGTIESLSGTLRLFGSFDLAEGKLRAGSGAVIQLYGGGQIAGNLETGTNGRVEFASGTWTHAPDLTSISGAGVLRFTGGTLQVRELIPTLEFRGGTLVLLPEFQGGVITNLVMQGATLSGSNFVTGTLTCQSVTGPLLVGAGATVNWTDGTVSGPLTVLANGTLQVSGSPTKYLRAGLTNLGTVLHQDSGTLQLYGSSGAAIHNAGLWEVQSDTHIYGLDATPVFRNLGLFRKAAGTGSSDLGVASSYPLSIQNRGTIEAQTGTVELFGPLDLTNGVVRARSGAVVQLKGGGFVAGGYETETNGRIELVSGTWTQVPGLATVSGPGVLRLTGGTLEIRELIPTMEMRGGTVVLLPGFQGGVITNLVMQGATLSGSNVVTGTLTCQSVTGPLLIAGGGTVNWTDGTVSAPLNIQANGTLQISGPATKYLRAGLTNLGFVLHQNSGTLQLYGSSGAAIQNLGLWEVRADTHIYGLDASPVFRNVGTYRRTAGSGTAHIGVSSFYPVQLQNRGTIENQVGTLELFGLLDLTNGVIRAASGTVVQLRGDSFIAGTYETETNARIEFASGTWTQVPGLATVSGSGVLRFTGGTLRIQELIPTMEFQGGTLVLLPGFQGGAITNLVMQGTTLSGSNYVTGTLICQNVTGPMVVGGGATVNWTSGTISAALNIEANGTLDMSGSSTKYLRAGLTNAGTVIHQNGGTLQLYGSSGAAIQNQGLWEVRADTHIYGLDATPVFRNQGTYRKTAGTGTAHIGVGSYYPVSLQNLGTIESQTGTVNLFGSYDLTNGVLRSAIRAANNFGRFEFGGSATLAGTISAYFVGDYLPVKGNKFTLVTFPSATGTFGTLALPSGLTWFPDLAAANFSITVLGVCTAPPTGLLGWWPAENSASDLITGTQGTLLNGAGYVAGFNGQAFSLDGVDDSVVLSAASQNQSFTVVCWIKPDAVQTAQATIIDNNSTDTRSWTVQSTGTGTQFQFKGAGLSPVTFALQPDGWQLLVLTVDESYTSRVYTNGSIAASSSAAGPLIYNGSEYLTLGGWGAGGRSFKGALDEVLLLSRALGSNEVAAIYSAGSAGLCRPTDPPFIVTNPVNRTNALAQTATFSVSAAGSPPLFYQWFHNGTALTNGGRIAGAHSSVLSISMVELGDAGIYAVRVTNAVGMAESTVAQLTVDPTPPAISQIVVTPGLTQATIAWRTDEPATSIVNYGPTDSLGSTSQQTSLLKTTHSIVLSGLAPGTTYYYRLRSADAVGNPGSTDVMTFTQNAAPDLAVVKVQAPPAAQVGQSIPVTFTITNSGSAAAGGAWYNAIYAANNTAGSGATHLSSPRYDAGMVGIVPGASVTVTQTFIVPASIVGTKYVGVRVDSSGHVVEMDESNNTTYSAEATVTTAPDLRVVSVSAPAAAQFGQSVQVQFVITNAGTAAAPFQWQDRVNFTSVQDSIYSGSVLQTVNSVVSMLQPGQSYTNSVQVTLPLSTQAVAGNYFIVVAADFGNAIAESNENNNVASAPLVLTLPPLPDLAVFEVRAPANALPGEAIAVRWGVTNQGTLAANGTWSESVFVGPESNGTGLQELATFSFTNALSAGASLARTQMVTVPATGIAGSLWFAVRVDSRSDVIESIETNNIAVSSAATIVPAVLTLQVSSAQIKEGASSPLTFTVARNGARTNPLTVSISNSDASELATPAQVIIPAGHGSATFQGSAITDGIVDGPQMVSIGVSSAGFEPASVSVTVLDSDVPHLTLTLETNQVAEGFTVGGTVSRTGGSADPVSVVIATSSSAQLLPPAQITMAAGQSSAQLLLRALDDSLIEPPLLMSVTASAPGHNSASAEVLILDDDWPVLAMQANPLVVSESAGPQAAVLTVTRNAIAARAVEIELESSHPDALRVPALVVIPAGALSASVTLAAVDNSLVDGEKPVIVQGRFRATGTKNLLGDPVNVMVTVTDNDGLTLGLTFNRTLVAEGQATAATGTVSRNTGTSQELVVALLSSDTSEITVPASLVIPAGAASAQFTVASVDDGSTDGNQTVSVMASAPGFTSAAAQITVTDIDLPDLVAAAVSGPATAETEAFVGISYQVRNQGTAASISNAVVQRIYLSRDPLVGDDVLIGQYTFNGGLPAGTQFEQTFSARMPQAPGDYWVIAQVDVNDAVVEVIEDNNVTVASVPIRVNAAYEAEVATTVDTAPANTPIPFTGRAFKPGGQPAPFSPVNIHVRVRETSRIIAAVTDASGNFTTVWQPLPGEAGLYTIAAGHPGTANPTAQDSFRLLGMKADPASPFVRLAEQSSASGIVKIQNLGDMVLTGLAVEIVGKPSNVDVSLTLQTNRLEGLAAVDLAYGISALNASFPSGAIGVRVTSTKGAKLEFLIRVAVDALVPRLVATPQQLQGGMKRGVQRMVEFQVANNGGAATGPVSLSLPALSWMRLVSPNPMPSLAPGESTTVSLQLTPPEDLPLTIYTGNLALNAPGTGISVPFSFRALSEANGALQVVSVDEFTYYAEGSPRVTNATVRVRDTLSGTVVTNGVTSANGVFFMEPIAEGYYDVELTADQHSAFRGTVYVEPGITNEVTAFLSYQTVRYTWTVERIEIEDRYRITVETEFEANVPAPVVTIEPAVLDVSDLTVVGQMKQVSLTIRNHGLIAVDGVRLSFGTHPFYSIEPLIDDLGRLAAKSSLTIPVTMRRTGDFNIQGVRVAAAGSGVPCGMGGNLSFSFECGPVTVGGGASIPVSGVQGDCTSGPVYSPGWGGGGGFSGGGGWGGGGGGGGGGGVSAGYSSVSVGIKIGCDPKCLVLAALGCIPGPIGCAASGAGCGSGLAGGVTALGVLDCAIGGAGCLIPGAGLPACIYGLMRCFLTPTAGAEQLYLASSGDDMVDYYKPGIRAQLDAFNLITGAPDGLWFNPQADTTTGDWYAAFMMAVSEGSEAGRTISSAERTALLAREQPPGVPASEVARVLDRWNRTLANVELGILRPEDAPPGANLDFIDTVLLKEKMILAAAYDEQAKAAGFTDPINAMVDTIRFREQAGESGGVCGRVKIRLDQEAVLSREAFRATLDIENGSPSALQNIRVLVRVTDASGADATSLFGIHPPDLTGLSDVNGGGSVAGNGSGTARWTIVPSVDAAPVEPVRYFVSGEFRYTFNGTVVAVPLAPVSITVNPTARLTLDYFHERDVYSDDPYTDIIEPSVPFNLAVMVRNKGAGEARQFRITSAQPQIVENEKGLLIDFKIIATEVAGQSMTPSLTANLGNIPPGGTAIGRWLLTSTLQGLFINYSATFEHLDGMGNPRLSLIDEVRIHEMIRLVNAGGPFEDGKPDFLVNDRPDLMDLPDTLWMSDGSSNAVEVVTSATMSGTLSAGNLQVQLLAAMPGGWAYLRVPDPGAGQYRLVGVQRSDSVPVPAANAWTTDRTFHGQGKRPVNENNLHLLDYNSSGIYTLTYQRIPEPDSVAPSSTVAALASNSRSLFLVSWSGQDNEGGSGVAGYDVFVSENGGPFQRWLTSTPTTSALFQGQLGKTYAFYSLAIDTAGNRETAPDAADAQTAVTVENRAPVFVAMPNITLVEGDSLSIVVSASDPDGDTVTYSLVSGAPAGLLLNAQSGAMTWTTGEAHGPGTNAISVRATDNGFPQMSSTQAFTLIVLESNSPPVLQPVPNYTIRERRLLAVTNIATDVDLPRQNLAFGLLNAPAGASIDPKTGVLTWQPTDLQGGTTNVLTVFVTDDGPPPLTATQSFTVIVLDNMPDFVLGIGSTAVVSPGSAVSPPPANTGSVPLLLSSGVDLKDLRMEVTISGERLTNWTLTGLSPEVAFANILPSAEPGRFSVEFQSRADSILQGNLALAQLGFGILTNEHSAVVHLRGDHVQGHRENSGQPVRGAAGAGRVFVVGKEPILDLSPVSGEQVALLIYALPGARYAIERSAVSGFGVWEFETFVDALELRTDLPLRDNKPGGEFFRAYLVEDSASLLTIRLEGGLVIVEWSTDCHGCVLQSASALSSAPGAWTNEQATVLQVDGRNRVVFPAGSGSKFLRLSVPTGSN